MSEVGSDCSEGRRSLINRNRRREFRNTDSDGANRGTGADVDDADSPVALGAMDLLALDDRPGEATGNGAHSATRARVDDSDSGSFQFCCVGHSSLVFSGLFLSWALFQGRGNARVPMSRWRM